jgi:hypothetical protein
VNLKKTRDVVAAARLRRALERVALLSAAYEAHTMTAEAAAYEAGQVAAAELTRRKGAGRR